MSTVGVCGGATTRVGRIVDPRSTTAAPPAPLDTCRPFSRAAATAVGITLRELRTVAYRTVFTGVYLKTSVRVAPRIRAEAALVPFAADAVASHASAARMLELPIPALPDEHVTVLRQQDRRSRPGLGCHLATTPIDVLVVGDHLVRRDRVGRQQLVDFCESATGPGAVLARRAAG